MLVVLLFGYRTGTATANFGNSGFIRGLLEWFNQAHYFGVAFYIAVCLGDTSAVAALSYTNWFSHGSAAIER